MAQKFRARADIEGQKPSGGFLLGIQILEQLEGSPHGSIVRCIRSSFTEILRELERDPRRRYEFVQNPRLFEEFVAATYDGQGFRVTLTPRSGDKGRDIIAEKNGHGSLRILDQCKAYSEARVVGLDDVRAMIGVLSMDPNASKAVISTTSSFAPGVLTSPEIQAMVPYRLELRDGEALSDWLRSVSS